MDRDTLLSRLTQAYADEWYAHYNYQFAANTLRGHRAPELLLYLRRRTAQAIDRANRLADRLIQLGGRPPAKLNDLAGHATDKRFKLPSSMADVDGVLRAVLDAERTSLRTYAALHEATVVGDPVTAAMVLDLLVAAVRNEETLERLLGQPAREMDGT
jgi:ferritin-like protein